MRPRPRNRTAPGRPSPPRSSRPDCPCVWASVIRSSSAASSLGLADLPLPQPVQDVVPKRSGKQHRIDAGIADAPPDLGARQPGEVPLPDLELSRMVVRAPRQHPGHRSGGRAAIGDDREARGQIEPEAGVLDHLVAMAVERLQTRRHEFARQRRLVRRYLVVILVDWHQLLGGEIADDLVVLHLHVEPLLVPVDQAPSGAAAAPDRPR